MMLAPDTRGRKLAAVFTTKDAADSFVMATKESVVDTGNRVFDGEELFSLGKWWWHCF